MKMKKIVCLFVLALASGALFAEIKLADPFADGMVLQRDRKVPVWGTAKPGAKVKVVFAGVETCAVADENGRWRVGIPAMPYSAESRTLTASEDGGNVVTVSDVLVGDVWFVSGQSNTEFPLCSGNPHYSDRNGAAIAQKTHMPLVRFCCQSSYKMSLEPKAEASMPVVWRKFNPKNLVSPSFSAMACYFAIEVHKATGIPLGLVGAYWGGTGIDSWTPREGTASRPDLKDILEWKSSLTWDGKNPKSLWSHCRVIDQPHLLWNEMVNPWCPYAMRGLLWYQGCTNSREYERYVSKMHALYHGWSTKFENSDMKFYFVQLAPWGYADIAKMQEAQAEYEREEPNSAMAVISDLGNLRDIHPNEKGTVGLRLALHALKRDYGFTDIQDNSPTLKSWRIENGAFHLEFNDSRRLYLYNSDFSDVTPFEIAGEDGVFKPAKIANLHLTVHKNGRKEYRGNIDGNFLLVKAEGVENPKCLRYLYSRPWHATVYNEVNLPLGAFHIDAP
jgi:sialate O-acetylesterase